MARPPVDKTQIAFQAALLKRVQSFTQSKLQSKPVQPGQRLSDLIENLAPLSSDQVEELLLPEYKKLIPPEELSEIKDTFLHMVGNLNRFPPVKRFFILETMDFFRSSISIAKLIPPLILLQGEEQKKAIAEFIKPTFVSINKNVEILTATNQIFDSKRIHLERGSLYSFISDTAKIITELFEPEYLQEFINVHGSVDLVGQIIESNPYFTNNKIPTAPLEGMISDTVRLRKTLLSFVCSIQSHEALYNYATKRHAYYKLFLKNAILPGKFRDVPPYEASLLLAACLWTNKQLAPSKDFIASLMDANSFQSEETQQKLARFLDLLAPKTVYQVILDLKAAMQNLTHQSSMAEFGLLQKLSIKNILKTVWKAVILFGEKSLAFASAPFRLIFEGLKATYTAFIKDNAAEMEEDGETAPLSHVPRSLQSLRVVSQKYKIVSTDIVGLRGEYEGASQKDRNISLQCFGGEEGLGQFTFVFELLLKHLQQNEHVKIFSLPSNRAVKEYHLSLLFGAHLFCFGLTHLKAHEEVGIQKQDIFPYALLLHKAERKTFGRALSRIVPETGYLYNEAPPESVQAKALVYESLFHALHLLPESYWEEEHLQKALLFLYARLNEIAEKGERFLFMERLPPAK